MTTTALPKPLIKSCWWCWTCGKGTWQPTKAGACPSCQTISLLQVRIMPPEPTKPEYFER